MSDPINSRENMVLQSEKGTTTPKRERSLDTLALQPQNLSKKDVFPFLKLPGELRNAVYGYSLDWNEAVSKWTRAIARIDLHDDGQLRLKGPQPTRTTPVILQLNRQITTEAQGILREKPLVIDMSRRSFLPVLNFTKFISKDTLRFVQSVDFLLPAEETLHYPPQAMLQLLIFNGRRFGGLEQIRAIIGGKEMLTLDIDPDKGLEITEFDVDMCAWADYCCLRAFVLARGGTVRSLKKDD